MAANASCVDTHSHAAVRQVVEGIIAADNAEDIGQVLEYYATDAVLIVPDAPDVVGLSAIRDHYEGLFANADFKIAPHIDEIAVDRNQAIVRGVNLVTSTSADPQETVCVASKYLMSLKRTEDRWTIAHLMWTNRPVPC